MMITDNHMHLRRDGRFLEAAKEFRDAGGTHMTLVQYPCADVVSKHKSYMPIYEETLRVADEVRKEVGIVVFVAIGPYPIDLLHFLESMDEDQAVALMKKGMDEASWLCGEKKAIAIGEIGRPHFTVDRNIWDLSNDILSYGMGCAADVDVPVILHTESTTTESCHEFVSMGKEAGLRPKQIVKHFSPPLINFEENGGLMPSIISREKNIISAIEKGTRFLMETDYIDDPKRPGLVCGPKTVPKLTKRLLEKEILSVDEVYRIHVKNMEETYGISFDE